MSCLYIVGSNGLLGSRLLPYLQEIFDQIIPLSMNFDRSHFLLSTSEICNLLSENFPDNLFLYEGHPTLLFAHRLREFECEPSFAVHAEISFLDSITTFVSKRFSSLNIILIGSCTGKLYDRNSTLAYHLVKDVQESYMRYVGLNSDKIFANTIEISYFTKYLHDESSKEYLLSMHRSESAFNRYLPSYQQLAHLISYLSLPNIGFSGQTLRLDNGVRSIQANF